MYPIGRFDFNSVSILYRFRDIPVAGYLSKVADFDPPHLPSAPLWGRPRSNSAEIFGVRKLESLGGVVFVILCLAVLVELRLVTDGQTQTGGHRPMASTADA